MNLQSINWSLVISAAVGAFFTHSLSIRLGPVDITAATTTGTPTHLTFAMIWKAGLAAMSGQTGTVQVGDVAVTITQHTAPIPAPPSVATLLPALASAVGNTPSVKPPAAGP